MKCCNFIANSERRVTKLGTCVLLSSLLMGGGVKRYLVIVQLRQGVNTENENQIWNNNAQIQHLDIY